MSKKSGGSRSALGSWGNARIATVVAGAVLGLYAGGKLIQVAMGWNTNKESWSYKAADAFGWTKKTPPA